MLDMKVSIIVPVYNAERFLSICLDSIINQTYKNIEILLIDDGSTDSSLAIMKEYERRDNRIIVVHQENKGVSTTRNNGIERSTGHYVCFADADDILMPDYIDYLLSMSLIHNVDVAVTTEMFTTFGGKQVKRENVSVVQGEEAAKAILYYHIPIGVYCKMFRRDFLGSSIRFIPEVFIGEGFNFNTLAFQKAARVAIGNRKVYCYRRDNAESAMTKFSLEKCKMAIKAIGIIKDHLCVHSNSLEDACRFAYWHTCGDMYNWMVLAKVQTKYPDMYRECYQAVRKYSFKAVRAPLNSKERLRAILQCIHPRLLATVLEMRRFKAKMLK